MYVLRVRQWLSPPGGDSEAAKEAERSGVHRVVLFADSVWHACVNRDARFDLYSNGDYTVMNVCVLRVRLREYD
jgi:hypothetical protein